MTDQYLYYRYSQRNYSSQKNPAKNTTELPSKNRDMHKIPSSSNSNPQNCHTPPDSNRGTSQCNQNQDFSHEKFILQTEISRLQKQIQTLQSNLDWEKNQSKQKEEQHQKQLSDLSQEMQNQRWNYEQERKMMEQRYNSLKEQSSQQNHEFQKLKQAYQNQTIVIKEKDRNIDDHKKTIVQKEEIIGTRDQEIRDLKKHLANLRKYAVSTYNSCDFALLIPRVQTYISQYAQYLLQIAKGNAIVPPSATEIESQIANYNKVIRNLAGQFLNTPYKKYNIPIPGDFAALKLDFTCSFVQENDVHPFQELCNNWKEVGQMVLSKKSDFTQVIQDKMDAFTNTVLKFPDIQKLTNKCSILLSKIKQYQSAIRNLASELDNAKRKIKELEELKESLNKTIGLYEANKKEQDTNIHNLRQIVTKQMAVAKKENEIQINQIIKMHQEEIQNLIQCFQ